MAVVPRIAEFNLPAVLPFSLPLLCGAATAVEVAAVVAEPRIPPLPRGVPSPPLGAPVAAAVQISAVSRAAAVRIPPCPPAVPPVAPPPAIPTPDPPVSRAH